MEDFSENENISNSTSKKVNHPLTVFHSDGSLPLLEQAMRNADNGNPCVGIAKHEELAFISVCNEKSCLVEKWLVPKIINIGENLILTFCGNEADSRSICSYVKKQCARYKLIHEKPIPITTLVNRVATRLHQYTSTGGNRPFITSILVGGLDGSAVIYKIDAGGEIFKYQKSIVILGAHNTMLVRELAENGELDLNCATKKCVSVLSNVYNLLPGDIQIGYLKKSGFDLTIV